MKRLTFAHKYFNSNKNIKKNQDISWIWDEKPIPVQEAEKEESNDD